MDSYSITPPPFRGLQADPLDSDATVIGPRSSITPHQYPAGLTTRELAHALRGEMLGHFLLQQYIGGGGMGVVFKALDTTLDRIVAVKVVASHRVDSDDLQRRFLVEAQLTARLDHPNIARVHYIGRDRGLPYIVFEFIDGVNIRDLTVERGPLPVGQSLSYVYQIAHALAHAWQRDVVHRDIKPSNILVTADGQAKLVDMGLARLRQLDGEDEDEDLTATGITLGTFDYISPEQARDPRLADARSDIYSLGCTLYYMLAGRAPFAQGTGLQKLLQHQSERPPDLRTYRADVPEPVVRLVRRMLEKDPADRPQSPLELVGELTPIMEALDVPLPYPAAPYGWTVASRPAARWRRHAAWLAPAALLVGFAAIVDGYWRDSSPAAAFPPLREGLPEAAAPPVAGSGADKTAAGALARGAAPTTGRTSTAPAAPAGRPESSPPYRSSSATLEGPLEAGASLWDIVTGAAAPRAGGHQWRLNDGAIGPQISPGGFEAAPLGAPPEVELPFNAGELPSGSAPNSQQP